MTPEYKEPVALEPTAPSRRTPMTPNRDLIERLNAGVPTEPGCNHPIWSDIEKADATMAEAATAIASSATRIAELEASNKALSDEIDNLEQEGCDYDDTIRKLETRLATTQSAYGILERFAQRVAANDKATAKTAIAISIAASEAIKQARAATRTAGGEDAQ